MRRRRVVLLSTLLIFAAGCSFVRPAAPPAAPTGNQALVVFLGDAVNALLYDISDGDEERFIGITEPNKKVGYVSPAGRRRFMAVGEAADFLDADLLPGKTYYALVTTRRGIWASRFAFRPLRRAETESGPEAERIAELTWVEANERGQRYASDHRRTVHDKKLGNLRKHEAKSAIERDKVRLDEADGV